MVRFGDARLGDDLSGVDVARRQVGQLVDAGEASLEKNKPTNKKKTIEYRRPVVGGRSDTE